MKERKKGGKMARRFYKSAEVVGAGPFTVQLDGRKLKTPLKRLLALERRKIATAIAEEWDKQAEEINPSSMPVTRLANTAIDRVAGREEEVAAEIVRFAGSDLICYRAEGPEDLSRREAEHWDPLLQWAEERFGARLNVIKGIVHEPQPQETLEVLKLHLLEMNPDKLCAVHNLTTLMGSALLAIAVAAQRLTPEEAWLAAHVDEDWQIEHWGNVKDALDRRSKRHREFTDTVRFLCLLD